MKESSPIAEVYLSMSWFLAESVLILKAGYQLLAQVPLPLGHEPAGDSPGDGRQCGLLRRLSLQGLLCGLHHG